MPIRPPQYMFWSIGPLYRATSPEYTAPAELKVGKAMSACTWTSAWETPLTVEIASSLLASCDVGSMTLVTSWLLTTCESPSWSIQLGPSSPLARLKLSLNGSGTLLSGTALAEKLSWMTPLEVRRPTPPGPVSMVSVVKATSV